MAGVYRLYMSGECYLCNGLVMPDESGHLKLDDHGDHRVYLHERCAAGYDLVRELPGGQVDVTCPECDVVETH